MPADDHYTLRSAKKKSRWITPFWLVAEKKKELRIPLNGARQQKAGAESSKYYI
jgi:hypothetical protein